MSKKVGVTKETLHNLVLDAGYVYINYKLDGEKAIGATTDGNTFTAEREIKEIEADNMKGKTKGMRRIISYNASLGVNFFEQTPENIKMAFSAADITEPETGVTRIQPRLNIEDADYFENIALVCPYGKSGKWCEIVIKNAMSDDDSVELSLETNEEGNIPVTLSAHYDADELDEVPFYIDIIDPPAEPITEGGEE